MGVPHPLLSLRSLWGRSHIPLGVPCPFGGILCPLLSLWAVPHPFGGGPVSLWGSHVSSCPLGPCWGVPCSFEGPMFPPVPLGCPSSLWGGSQVSFGVPCPFGGGPVSLWGSHVPSCPLGPCWGVPCPFEGPTSPPVPLGCPSSLWGGSMSLWGSHVPSFPFGLSLIPLGRGPTSLRGSHIPSHHSNPFGGSPSPPPPHEPPQ